MTDPNPNFTPSQEHNACSNAPSATISRNSSPASEHPTPSNALKPNCAARNAPDPENSIPSGAKSSLISIPTQRTIRTPANDLPSPKGQDPFGLGPLRGDSNDARNNPHAPNYQDSRRRGNHSRNPWRPWTPSRCLGFRYLELQQNQAGQSAGGMIHIAVWSLLMTTPPAPMSRSRMIVSIFERVTDALRSWASPLKGSRSTRGCAAHGARAGLRPIGSRSLTQAKGLPHTTSPRARPPQKGRTLSAPASRGLGHLPKTSSWAATTFFPTLASARAS